MTEIFLDSAAKLFYHRPLHRARARALKDMVTVVCIRMVTFDL